MDESGSEVKLPGFRFHPTEEELLNFYLKRMIFGKKLCGDIIGFLNIYKYDPTELPGLAKIGEREWYFFVPRDRKHGTGGRPNRTTEKGFWKATGSDRKILSLKDPKKMLGLKKTLVFYEGRAPRGRKTDWVMNEYRLPDHQDYTSAQVKDIVLCKIYRKATSLKALEQRAAMEEEEVKMFRAVSGGDDAPSPPIMDSISFCSQLELEEGNGSSELSDDMGFSTTITNKDITKIQVDDVEEEKADVRGIRGCSSLMLPDGKQNLADLQVPKFNMDWNQDWFWTQLRSPWFENFASFLPMC